MIAWDKQQLLYERKAYRIVQKHISRILKKLPKDVELYNYELTIELNVTYNDIYKMFKELYVTIGLDYGNKINKEIEKTKKANVLFNEQLLKEILLFLSSDGGVKITSVQDTLIEDIIKSIKDTLGPNATIIDLRNAIQKIIEKSQTFYKWQSLRIARTETTASSGFAAMKTAEQSDLVMTKEWIAAKDDRTRHDHRYLNGKSVDLEGNFLTEANVSISYPGDPKAPANEVINCRCTIGFKAKRDADGMLIFKK